MADRSVFRSLREVFPQVDVRILKAVAIEHSKDVDAAVEFILSEVLPSLSISSDESHDQTQDAHLAKGGLNESNVSLRDQEVEEIITFPLPTPNAEPCIAAGSCDSVPLGHVNSTYSSEAIAGSTEQSSLAPSDEMVGEKGSPSSKIDSDNSPFRIDGGNGPTPLSAEPEDVLLLEQMEDTLQSSLVSAENSSASFGAKETVSAIDANYQNLSRVIEMPYLMDYEMEKHVQNSLSQSEQILLPNSNLAPTGGDSSYPETNEPKSASHSFVPFMPVTSLENLIDTTTVVEEASNDANNTATEHEKDPPTGLEQNFGDFVTLDSVILPAQTTSDMSAFENALSSLESDVPPATSRSGHAVSIDFLEDLINVSKNNKNALASAVETASNMLKEVELLEERAKLAKEEASVAGQNTMTKVEELKQMLKHAKEANDMHAGEVYGEKSILAAEARELQSRILNLSNEKNTYLPVIEEMRQTLEARLGAAEKDLISVEQEKSEREELAQAVLHEQHITMDKIVEESEQLKQQAEENSKLREFLMDRGRMVDILQGEIAVICEDVTSLKDIIDGRLPLGRFQSVTTSSLASSLSSSASSVLKSVPSLDSVEEPAQTAESSGIESKGSPKLQMNSLDGVGKEAVNGDKQNSDDEWELFEAED